VLEAVLVNYYYYEVVRDATESRNTKNGLSIHQKCTNAKNLCYTKKLKSKPTHKLKNFSRMCLSLCTTVVHNTAQNSSDNLHS